MRRLYLLTIAALEKRIPRGYIFKSCEEITATLSKSMDQDSAWPQRLAVRFHFSYCRLCTRYAGHLETLRLLAHRLAEKGPDLDAATGLSEDAKRRIAEAMKRSQP